MYIVCFLCVGKKGTKAPEQSNENIIQHLTIIEAKIITTYFRLTLSLWFLMLSTSGAYDQGFFSGGPFAAMFKTASGITTI